MSKVGAYFESTKEYSSSTDIVQEYFLYLCSLLGERSEIYHILLRKLYNKEFYWTIENDKNRADDGKCLRDEFADTTNYLNYDDIDGPCNMLEMMIGVSRRMANLTYPGGYLDETDKYFWEILENLLVGYGRKMISIDLKDCTDDKISPLFIDLIDQKLDIFLERRFFKNGKMGLFPKKISGIDQTKVEIWTQIQYYLMKKMD